MFTHSLVAAAVADLGTLPMGDGHPSDTAAS
jgi:hypothetical protein